MQLSTISYPLFFSSEISSFLSKFLYFIISLIQSLIFSSSIEQESFYFQLRSLYMIKDLNLKVKKSKMSREEFVRECIKNVTVKEPPSLDYYRLINEFNRIGTNLNQLTKLAHVSTKLPDHQLENTLDELSFLVKKVDKEIRG